MASESTERDILRRARSVLASIYDRPENARMLLADIGIDHRRVDLSGPATEIGFRVLEEARKEGNVGALLERAIEDYPGSKDLQELAHLYGLSTGVPLSPAIDTAPRVFLSFAESDATLIAARRERLAVMGFVPVLAAESRSLGEDLRAGVLRAIEGSDATLLAVSAASQSSARVAGELRLALERRLRGSGYVVIPVHLDDTAAPKELAQVAALDLRGFQGGLIPPAAVSALTTLRERLGLGRAAPQVIEEADRAVDPLLTFLRRLAAS